MDAAELETEREALIAEIYAAFKDVSREGGVSRFEAFVIDDRGSDEECAAARARDTDTSWTELVDDPGWQSPGVFSFLDAIGFRYYLPVVLVRTLRTGEEDDALPDHISLPRIPADDAVAECLDKLPKQLGDIDGLNYHTLSQWVLLTDRQRCCVARFIRFWILVIRDRALQQQGPDREWIQSYANDWVRAYESYWKSFE